MAILASDEKKRTNKPLRAILLGFCQCCKKGAGGSGLKWNPRNAGERLANLLVVMLLAAILVTAVPFFLFASGTVCFVCCWVREGYAFHPDGGACAAHNWIVYSITKLFAVMVLVILPVVTYVKKKKEEIKQKALAAKKP